ncbi:GNAT family N-acetyltransferase [Methanofollis aquaemaris]|uniref:hypothetical protein n=1 Tax=Methanofollis aquaemaris TaxID=126734 RepID=UPI002240898F|nr:hypothetical protein [Methanofollis aquaemaris]
MTSRLTFTYLTRDDLPAVAAMLAKERVCAWLFFGLLREDLPERRLATLAERFKDMGRV